MTVLEHEALEKAMEKTHKLRDRLTITPLLDSDQIGPASIDLRLGTEFLLLRRTREAGLDPSEQDQDLVEEIQERVTVPLGDGLWLHPGQFVLGATLEYLHLPATLSGYVVGRSTWGRVGLIVATAIMVHPGYTGTLTLELANEGDSPIRLFPGVRICQLVLHSLKSRTAHGYGEGEAKYLAHTGPLAPRLEKEQGEIEQIQKLAGQLAGE